MSAPISCFEKHLKAMSYHHTLNMDLIKLSKPIENEIQEEFEPFDKKELEFVDAVFLFGLIDAKYLESFFSWLDENPKNHIFVCESNPSYYKHLFSKEDADKIYLKKNVHLLITPDGLNQAHAGFVDQIVTTLISTFNINVARFIEHPMLKDLTLARDKAYNKAIASGITLYHSTLQSLRGHSYKTLVNKLENLSINKNFFHSENLKDKFKGTPVVLCGAGFSLPKVYDKLKSIQSHTLIAAAGTGSTLLFKNGIESHITGILDVDPEKEHTINYNNHSGVLLYLLRSGCKAIAQHQGLKILCNAANEDKIISGLFDSLPNETLIPKEGYWTVSDFLFHKLLDMGFGPIYICGVDHVLSEKNYYGDSVTDPNVNNYSKKNHIKALNVHNEEVFTKVDWVLGSRSISNIANMYKNAKIYHVTDEGLPIEGVEVLSTKEFNELTFASTKCAEEQFLPQILSSPLQRVKDTKILMLIENLLQSCVDCKEILETTEIELGKLYAAWQITPIDSLNPYTGFFFNLQDRLNKQIVYQNYLEPYWRSCQSQLPYNSGYFDDPQKAKLTLFGLKIRELDYFKSHNGILFSLFSMQKKQILERIDKFDATYQAYLDNLSHQDSLKHQEPELV